jgi:hypothetical protein
MANIILPTDILGNPRMAGNFTIGAYQYSQASAIENISINNHLIYPTIANDILNIANLESHARISIYNVLGVQVISVECSGNQSINIDNLTKGNYFIRINENGKQTLARFIKQ